MALTFENINFNDTLFSKLKEFSLSSMKIIPIARKCTLEMEEKNVNSFLGHFSSMSNSEWINYKAITLKK